MALLGFNANAQGVDFGLKAGVNFANIGGDDADVVNAESRTSFHFGVTAGIPVSDNFSVQPELVYSSQGADYSFEEEGFSESGTLKLDYLNIPIMAKFQVADGFSLELGPQIGILLSADDEGEDLKDLFKGSDFSGAIGVNYQMATGLSFGARYNLGLGSISDFDDEDLKNNVFQVSIGYIFGKGNSGGE